MLILHCAPEESTERMGVRGGCLSHSGYAAAAPAVAVEAIKTLDAHGSRLKAKLGMGAALIRGQGRAGLDQW